MRSTCPQLGAAHCATALGPVSRVLRWPLLQNTFSTYMKYGRRWPLRPLLRGNIEIYDCHTNCSNDNDNKVLFNKMSLSFQTKGQKPASKCSHDFSIIGSNSFPTGVRT